LKSNRHRLHLAASRTHKWLALIIGAQLLIWFASGALMSFLPIDEVHGDHLVDRETVQPLPTAAVFADPARYIDRSGKAPDRVTLHMLHGQPVAEVAIGNTVRLFDAQTATPLPPVDTDLATAIARKAWRGAPVQSTTAQVTTASPEYRGRLPAWRVTFADKDRTNIFVAADTGQIAAVRTANWRLYDFFWGLHIMDWREHSNFNSWWLLGFAVAGLVLGLAGTILLMMRWPIRWRRRRSHVGS